MGRTGVTYSDVATAAAAIQAKGENPTVDRVRERLGTGSKGTISPLLKQWKHEQAPFLKEQPNALPPDLLNMTHSLWTGMKEKADEIIEAEKARFSQHAQSFEKAKLELTQRLQKTQTDAAQQKQVLASLQTAHADLQTQCQEHLQRIEYLTGQNTEQQQRIEENVSTISQLTEQAKLAYDNLEHFREATQQQREEEHLAFDQQRTEWFQQEKNQANAIAALKSENEQLNRALDEVTRDRNDLATSKRSYEKQSATYQAELEHQTQTLFKTEREVQLLEQKYSVLDQQHAAANATIQTLKDQLATAQTQLAQYHLLNEKLEIIQNQLENQGVLLDGQQEIVNEDVVK